jgi:hypothetical protein
MTAEFTLIFLAAIAVAAFIVKRMLNRRDEPPTVQEIVSELLPFINDPAALHRKFTRDLRRARIYAAGTITDITTTPETVVIEVRDLVFPQTAGGVTETHVIFDLLFQREDAPDDVDVDQYVEFTGVLIDVAVKHGAPVLTVDPGELLHIEDEPPDALGAEAEEPPDSSALPL